MRSRLVKRQGTGHVNSTLANVACVVTIGAFVVSILHTTVL